MCQKITRLIISMLLLCLVANAQTTTINTDFINQMNTAYTNCSYNLAVVPNPATSNINLSINNSVAGSQQSTTVLLSDTTGNDNNTEKKLITNTEGITKIYLYDFYTNQLVKKWTYQEDNSGTYNLNVADLKRGIYVLKMERDNVSSTTKIILQ